MLDDPNIKTIWLQWASRLGKTFFGQCSLLFYAATQPCPMMFASESEKTAIEVTERTYAMYAECRPIKEQLRPAHKRRQDKMDFDDCRAHVAWARSVGTLADKAVRFGHSNEVDKWEHVTTSKEADPLKLFTDRFKEFPTHKKLIESTPTVKGRSRIERGRLGGTNCKYYVPCPHCGMYQVLCADKWMDGYKWDHDAGGHSTKELARTTARYECAACKEIIEDRHRPKMMRRGVWCPEGCTVNSDSAAGLFVVGDKVHDDYKWRGWKHAEWIEGTPARDGVDASYHLSSHYAVSLTWGEIAAEFVSTKSKPQDLRNTVNQWFADTWEIVAHKQTWEKLGERLIEPTQPRGIVPEWASLVTVGIDRQHDHYVYVVEAWGPGRRSATIDYGDPETLDEIKVGVVEKYWQHADDGEAVRPLMTLIDSGHRQDIVYDWCLDCQKTQLYVWPCKGASTALNADYRVNTLGKDTSRPGMQVVFVDTINTQGWIDRVLHTLQRTDVGGTSLFSGPLAAHQDYLEQLLNDAAVEGLDRSNNVRENWNRIDANIPNDFRDCKRYAYVAMLLATRGKEIKPRVKAESQPAPMSRVSVRPDGRPWI